jgi:hypothetical protein
MRACVCLFVFACVWAARLTHPFISRTCTWLDLVNQYKSDIAGHIVKEVSCFESHKWSAMCRGADHNSTLPQAIKFKVGLGRSDSLQEEDGSEAQAPSKTASSLKREELLGIPSEGKSKGLKSSLKSGLKGIFGSRKHTKEAKDSKDAAESESEKDRESIAQLQLDLEGNASKDDEDVQSIRSV